MARAKGSVTTTEHRLRIAEAQRRRHAQLDKEEKLCPVCEKPCRGAQGLAVHLGMTHPEEDVSDRERHSGEVDGETDWEGVERGREGEVRVTSGSKSHA